MTAYLITEDGQVVKGTELTLEQKQAAAADRINTADAMIAEALGKIAEANQKINDANALLAEAAELNA